MTQDHPEWQRLRDLGMVLIPLTKEVCRYFPSAPFEVSGVIYDWRQGFSGVRSQPMIQLKSDTELTPEMRWSPEIAPEISL